MTNRLLTFIFFLLPICTLNSATHNGFTPFAEALYWHASQETSSTWASVLTFSSGLKVNDFTATNVYFDWDPGLRAGLTYEQEIAFDYKIYWTYFSSKSKDSLKTSAGQIILPEFFNGFTSGNFFFDANLDWQLEMNMVDAEIGHRINPIETLAFRPFIGLKGGAINQSINSIWNAVLYQSTESLKNNFYGIGPTLGIDSSWSLINHLNLIGDFSSALMWGNWHITDIYQRPEALLGLITPTTIFSDTKNSMLGTLMFRYFMGLEWSYQTNALVTLRAGYEMQWWNNQLRLPTFQQLPLRGDLTLQGATCGIYITV